MKGLPIFPASIHMKIAMSNCISEKEKTDLAEWQGELPEVSTVGLCDLLDQ